MREHGEDLELLARYFLGHLAPSGTAGFVMANSVAQSLASNRSGEGDSRKNIIEGDLVEYIVALPGAALLQA